MEKAVTFGRRGADVAETMRARLADNPPAYAPPKAVWQSTDLGPGHNVADSLIDGSVGSGQPDDAGLPIHVRKNIGFSPYVAGAVIGLVLLQMVVVPLMLGEPLNGFLHGSTQVIVGGAVLIFGAAIFLTRNLANLDIDEGGIRLVSRNKSYLFAWPDIDCAVPIRGAVRVNLKGRTDAQNAANLISDRFGISPDELTAAIGAGQKRWGARSNAGRSVCPGDDLTGLRRASNRVTLSVLVLGFSFCLTVLLIWQAYAYTKAVSLKEHGAPTLANVVRFYEDGCGRRSCSINVEYAFSPADGSPFAGRSYHGYDELTTTSRTDDPDYQYALQTHTIPVAYDVRDPSVSSANFRNEVFVKDPLRSTIIMLAVFGVLLLFGAGLMAAVFMATPGRATL